ncbi:ZIP zinc/iron transport family [Metschnikowia bicuspidata]|uniref:ZIP zinc/iron transport family n=1 Tax=Metschnikowia bicuspidata TaxID=27322 RepID=A0A4P9ZGZ3_9ASCO|nr:ZIP zinc/iron transport family [Metschnikowia bicuspidata]
MDECRTGNKYNGMMSLRISSIFVILVGSAFGSFFPLMCSRYSFLKLPPYFFFFCKYFGSGVIVATAFIHLLYPASNALSDDCLGAVWLAYPYAYAICMITLFALFFCEIMAFRVIERKTNADYSPSHFGTEGTLVQKDEEDSSNENKTGFSVNPDLSQRYPSHYAHAQVHQDPEAIGTHLEDIYKEGYYGQLLNVFVLEFGVVVHSVFVGLTLAVAGEEFKTLYAVIMFHQLFEGLGLGARIAAIYWPKDKRATPWLLALAYAITTPIAIAIGLGVRTTFPTESKTSLITNGIFDSISAGILLYAGLIEVMAHEFLFSNEFKLPNGLGRMILAFIIMCFGTGIMALLGKWA